MRFLVTFAPTLFLLPSASHATQASIGTELLFNTSDPAVIQCMRNCALQVQQPELHSILQDSAVNDLIAQPTPVSNDRVKDLESGHPDIVPDMWDVSIHRLGPWDEELQRWRWEALLNIPKKPAAARAVSVAVDGIEQNQLATDTNANPDTILEKDVDWVAFVQEHGLRNPFLAWALEPSPVYTPPKRVLQQDNIEDTPFRYYLTWVEEMVCGPWHSSTPIKKRPYRIPEGAEDPCLSLDKSKVYAEYREIKDTKGREGLPARYLHWEHGMRNQWMPPHAEGR
ncbi:hypothetical protein BJ508DRAFT_306304 [Ascobolus immersus RN42]|uniref:Uncharacterized protein n=1 Tax=Ascobolus immersus RN42 TaxID=1160509 RepID=A0A3N4I6I3_ASCIM|nr:hypothetical protein BJ508DRAFT_306304 [Ascobolus immersus RN42]